MPNLIQLLLKQDRSQESSPTPSHHKKQKSQQKRNQSLSSSSTQSAIDLYNAAVKAMQRLKHIHGLPTVFNRQDNIDQHLATSLTAMLAEVNLLETQHYQAVQEAIQQWQPRHQSEQWKCDAVKKVLLSLLPAARQKQQLEQACLCYKAHLKSRIESALSDQFPQTYHRYGTSRVELIAVRGQENFQSHAVAANDMDFFVTHQSRLLPIQDENLALSIQKYQAMIIVNQTLQSLKPAPAQVEDFSRQFATSRGVINQRRDSAGMIFLKAVATIFSLGVAVLAGIWSVEGRKMIKNVDQSLKKQDDTAKTAACDL